MLTTAALAIGATATATPAQAYGYSQSYSIQFSNYLYYNTGEKVWNAVKPVLRSVFPLSGMVNNPKVGQKLILFGNNPVRVTEVGSRHFALVSLPGHQEGSGNYINFTFDAYKLHVRASGPATNPTNPILPRALWTTFAFKVNAWLCPGCGYGNSVDPTGGSGA